MDTYSLQNVSMLKGRFKLIALDLDGTLLNHEKTIGPRNIEALRRAYASGCAIVLTTGRHPSSAVLYSSILQCLGENSFAVVFNGAAVVSLAEYQAAGVTVGFPVKYARTLTSHEVMAIAETAHAHGCEMHGYSCQRGLVIDDFNPYSQREIVHNFMLAQKINFKKCRAAETFYKVLAVGPQERIDALRADLPAAMTASFSVLRSDPNYLEFIPGGCTKGTALYELCKMMDIDLSQTIAFGDAENDQAMVRAAGLGVAMANAQPQVLETADLVTTSNEDDGIAAVIGQLF